MAKDIFHDDFKEALENANWVITDDPLKLLYKGQNLEVDIGAEQVIGAKKGGKTIAVEIKSFTRRSAINAFHEALGQFINYRRVLRKTEPDRLLYLAVPKEAYLTFFQKPFAQEAIEEEGILMIIFDPTKKKILKWIH